MMIKKYITKALVYSICLVAGLSFAACNDDEGTDPNADPIIRYFRPTDANKADSMIVDLSLGQTVAMIGENLDNIVAIKFNDQEVALNPCYVTPTAVIFTTPVAIPIDVTNKLYLTCRNGNVVEYATETILPAPNIDDVSKGYLKAGDVVTIKGNYFIPTEDVPVEIILPGSVTVTPDETSTFTSLTFTVPEGITQSGCLTVETAFGTTNWPYDIVVYNDLVESKVEGLLFDFDGKNGAMEKANGWRPGYPSEPTVKLSGNACLFDHGGKPLDGDWIEDNMALNYWPTADDNILTRVPVDKIENYAYQMEIFVENIWPEMCLAIQPTSLENVSADNMNNKYYSTVASYLYEPYLTMPDFTTNGQWITLTMPLTQFTKTLEGKGVDAPTIDDLAGLTIRWSSADASKYTVLFQPKLYFDNVRLVKKKY